MTLQEENDSLREQIILLQEALVPSSTLLWTQLTWKLTASQAKVLTMLLSRESVHKEGMLIMLYGRREWADTRITDVFICRIRAAIRPLSIETLWGRGWWIEPLEKRKFLFEIERTKLRYELNKRKVHDKAS